MKFVKILEETRPSHVEEKFIDVDKIKYIERLRDTKAYILDDEIFKTKIRMYGDNCEYDIIIPVEVDLVIAYLNNEEDFAAVKNYKIPKPEAPEDLGTWTNLRGIYSDECRVIKTLIRNGIKTKSDLVKLSESEILEIQRISKNGAIAIKRAMKRFGLELREERKDQ